ncbi:MAG: DUF5671 domain-containing protein [Patescibacteria group bacterium]
METQENLGGNTPRFNIGFFFLSLGVLITLVTTVVSFLNLVFETLNKRFPDVLNATYQYGFNSYDYEGIRGALSTLIIFFPVFLLLAYFWKKLYARGVGRLDETIRKWVIYIILFLSALVIVIDLVTLVRYFIAGEITTRFILKVAIALLTAAFVGFNFIFELRGMKKIWGFSVGLWGAIKSSLIVLLAIVLSFIVMGSPWQQRQLRLDDRRVGDLQNIQYQVVNYWQLKQKLPKDVSELANPLSGWSLPVPPEFEKGEKYEYAVKSPLTFELCATFALPIPKGWREYSGGPIYPMPMMEGRDMAVSYPYPSPGGGMNESWDHQAGRTCFERTIDKDLYPPYPKPL